MFGTFEVVVCSHHSVGLCQVVILYKTVFQTCQTDLCQAVPAVMQTNLSSSPLGSTHVCLSVIWGLYLLVFNVRSCNFVQMNKSHFSNQRFSNAVLFNIYLDFL